MKTKYFSNLTDIIAAIEKANGKLKGIYVADTETGGLYVDLKIIIKEDEENQDVG